MLKFCTLVRQHNENVEEWTGRLRIAAIECNYIERDRQLKKQFIIRLNDNGMMLEIIKELTKLKKMLNVMKDFNEQARWRPKRHKQQLWTIWKKTRNSIPHDQKSRKDKSIKYKIAKQAHVNTVDSATHLEDAHYMGRDVGNAVRWITLEQCEEAKDIQHSMSRARQSRARQINE